MDAHVLVLNFNGRDLLARCLPSIVQAAEQSRHRVRVSVVDNDSTDGSHEFVRDAHPSVGWFACENRGLCSYNAVLHRIDEPLAVLLNNDIELAADCLDPLLAPLARACADPRDRTFATAPMLMTADRQGYDGQRTSVRFRWGIVQATSHFAGCELVRQEGGKTAAAGAALAVHRERFLSLGGFDDLYLPGRLEDLDLGFRAHQAEYHLWHVPSAVGFHLGAATYGREFSSADCDALTLRNTLLFQWKHLHVPRHRRRQWAGLGVRLAYEAVSWPFTPRERRFRTWRAIRAARRQLRALGRRFPQRVSPAACEREEGFFHEFHPRSMFARAVERQVAVQLEGRMATPRVQIALESPAGGGWEGRTTC